MIFLLFFPNKNCVRSDSYVVLDVFMIWFMFLNSFGVECCQECFLSSYNSRKKVRFGLNGNLGL